VGTTGRMLFGVDADIVVAEAKTATGTEDEI
jgi:hypothetical protein